MREFAKQLYNTKAWQHCREGYRASVGGLCERCLSRGLYKAGEIVHHKIYLNADNINDMDIALNWDNLELLCRDCHAQEHDAKKLRYKVDGFGRILPR